MGWNATPSGIDFKNVLNCEPNGGFPTKNSDNSIYAWMQSVAAPRILETNNFDVSQGGYVSFDFRMASDDDGGDGCEAPDNKEGVYIQYSTNNGLTWINMKLMFPTIPGGATILGCGNYVFYWNRTTIPIPSGALSTNTKFRWYQANATSSDEDSWGIDNVIISTPKPTTISFYKNPSGSNNGTLISSSPNTSYSITASPVETTTYRAVITDGTSSCFKDITINVSPAPTITSQPVSVSICKNQNVSFNVAASGGNGQFQWQVNSGSGFVNLTNDATYSGVTSQTLTITNASQSMNNYKFQCIVKENLGLCPVSSETATLTITDPITPDFGQIGPLCKGANSLTLPLNSNNNPPISGTWNNSTVSTGSTGDFSFTFTSGTWSPSPNNTATTTYTFTPSGNQCASLKTMDIVVKPLPAANITASGSTTICQGESVILNANADPGLTYQWKKDGTIINGASTLSYTATSSGSYVVVTTKDNCSTSSAASVVTVNSPATPEFNLISSYCSGEPIPALPTTSTNNITGNWNPQINNTETTVYTFTPNSDQCATTVQKTITVKQIVTPQFSIVDTICANQTVDPLPSQSLNGINGSWNPILNLTTSTTYTFTPLTGECAGKIEKKIQVKQLIKPQFNLIEGSCKGDALNPLPLVSTNGISGSWNPQLNSTLTTKYFFTPSSNQCADTSSLTITIFSIPDVTVPSSQTECAGKLISGFNFIVSPPTAAVKWTNSESKIGLDTAGFSVIPQFTALNNDTLPITSVITVIPKSIEGCTGAAKTFNITINPNPVIQPVSNQKLCANDTTEAVTFDVYPSGVTVAWTNTNPLIGLPPSGIGNIGASFLTNPYAINSAQVGKITATPQLNGCSGSAESFSITLNALPVSINHIAKLESCGLKNGELQINATQGGNAPYQYSFNGAALSNVTNYTGLSTGIYPLLVSDVNSCTFKTTIVINSLKGPSAVDSVITSSNCGKPDGSITINAVNGGTPPYTYSFNGAGFSSGFTQSGLTPGTHTISVKDKNNCIYTTQINVPNLPGPNRIDSSYTASNCGLNDGSISVLAVYGGTAPYQYSFNNGAFTQVSTAGSLAAGKHTVIVKDNKGCTYTTSIISVDLTGITSVDSSAVNADCGGTDGRIEIRSVNGGTAPYTYNFGGQNTGATNYQSGLKSGIYSVIITDTKTCTYTTTIAVGSNPPITAQLSATVYEGVDSLQVTFINESSAGQGITYLLQFGDGKDTVLSDLSSVNYLYKGYNTFNPKLIVSNGKTLCNDTAQLKIFVDLSPFIEVPNIFSPNQDGINDFFSIKSFGYTELNMLIFNRWGNACAEIPNPEVGWDGGHLVAGTYFYILTGKKPDGSHYEHTGHLTLVR